MAGSVLLEYSNGEYSILMYDGNNNFVDRFDVAWGKLNLTRDAAIAISDDVLAYLNQ